eukprot:tig00021433_g21263.t1
MSTRTAKRQRTSAGSADASPLSGGDGRPSASSSASSSVVSRSLAQGETANIFACLPDALLARILCIAAGRTWKRIHPDRVSLLDERDAPSDVDLRSLVQLRLVCRRFKRVAMEPEIWERIVVRGPTDTALQYLTSLSPEVRRGVKRLGLIDARIGVNALRELAPAFAETLESLTISFPEEEVQKLPLAALPVLRSMHNLRILALWVSEKLLRSPQSKRFRSQSLQSTLRLFSRLSLLDTIKLNHIPLELPQLQALASISALRVLLVHVYVGQQESGAGAALRILGSMRSLQRLEVQFRSPSGKYAVLTTGEAELAPIGGLTNLRGLNLGAHCQSLAFVAQLPKLDDLSIHVTAPADVGPLAAAAGTLRLLWMQGFRMTPAGCERLADALRQLANLESLSLLCNEATMGALAQGPLVAWRNLRTVSLKNNEGGGIPAGLALRIAREARGVRVLRLESECGICEDVEMATALERLHRLELGKAVCAGLDNEKVEFLRSALPHVELQCDTVPGAPDTDED